MNLQLSGKCVAIVGNASSLVGAGHGPSIDSLDVVLRMNRGLPTDPTSQGSRTDILAFSVFPLVTDVYQQFNARTLVWMSPKGRDTIESDIEYYSIERWRALFEKLGARPSVGAMVLDLISSFTPSEVHLFGYDFKRTGTIYQSFQHVGPHDYVAEKKFCKELVDARKWHFHGS